MSTDWSCQEVSFCVYSKYVGNTKCISGHPFGRLGCQKHAASTAHEYESKTKVTSQVTLPSTCLQCITEVCCVNRIER